MGRARATLQPATRSLGLPRAGSSILCEKPKELLSILLGSSVTVFGFQEAGTGWPGYFLQSDVKQFIQAHQSTASQSPFKAVGQ